MNPDGSGGDANSGGSGGNANPGRAPLAFIQGRDSARVGATVTLDGSLSHDPDGGPLQFRWTLTVPLGSRATAGATDGPLF